MHSFHSNVSQAAMPTEDFFYGVADVEIGTLHSGLEDLASLRLMGPRLARALRLKVFNRQTWFNE